jgi:hypothetical protein
MLAMLALALLSLYQKIPSSNFPLSLRALIQISSSTSNGSNIGTKIDRQRRLLLAPREVSGLVTGVAATHTDCLLAYTNSTYKHARQGILVEPLPVHASSPALARGTASQPTIGGN